MTSKTNRSGSGWKSRLSPLGQLAGNRLVLVVLVALLLVAYLAGASTSGGERKQPAPDVAPIEAATTVWTCSMHPQVRMPGPGKCPICSMDLVPVDDGGDDDALGPRVLRMSASAAGLAKIETSLVGRRHIAHEVRMVGKVVPDETMVVYLTAWVPGRLDRLFVDYTGVTVREGDHMVEVYSPELYSGEQELLRAVETVKRLADSPVSVLYDSSRKMVDSSRERLRLWGMTPAQIDDVIERGVPEEHIVIYAPIGGVVLHKNAFEGMYVETGTRIYTIADLSTVWVMLDAYESDLRWLRYGQDVEFSTEAYPGQTFHARIAFIEPVLDDRTRTVKVRLNVKNDDLMLKPEMFIRATVKAVLTPHGRVVDSTLAGKWMCPMHPEVLADEPGFCPICGMDVKPVTELGFVTSAEHEAPLTIPATAPLITGKRAVVYVKLPDQDRPTFEGRTVTLGPRGGDYYVVRGGLSEGERVVSNGAFKIDSELQIRAKPSMMSPEAGGPAPGHQHGGAGDGGEPAAPGGKAALDKPLNVPPGFRDELRPVADAYLSLHAALAADDAAGTVIAAELLSESVAAVHADGLSAEATDRWTDLRAALDDAAGSVRAESDLEDQRAALARLSPAMERMLNTFGKPQGLEELGVFHCPMAAGGKGADWLQLGRDVSNPYLGLSMPRCGDRVRDVGGER